MLLKNYLVCFTENIVNRINDDDVFYDGDSLNESADRVFTVLAEDENSAKEQYLRRCAMEAYDKDEGIALIKRECAARVISRIIVGQILQLPREVLESCQLNRMVTTVYDAVAKTEDISKTPTLRDTFLHVKREIDLDEYVNLLDRESTIALYVDIFKKDVFIQELKII